MKRKSIIYVAVALILALVSAFVALNETGTWTPFGKKYPASSIFAIKDTSKITKVFLADMHGNTVLISRKGQGAWLINDSLRAMEEAVKTLLTTLNQLTVREPVAKVAQTNINASLAVSAVKVEVYEDVPKFTLFGFPCLTKERCTKTYYMGPATQDNMGNIAVIEGYNEPFVVHVPGFRGYVTPRYSTQVKDWLSHRLFETKITRIKSLESKDLEHPEESFFIEKAGTRFFHLYNAKHQQIMDYDTSKLLDMLSEYRDKNYEAEALDLPETTKDSILQYNLFKIITLTDVDDNIFELKLYWMTYSNNHDDDFRYETKKGYYPWNLDHFYGIFNGDKQTFYKMQFFHFDRQIQPLSYFIHKEHFSSN
ncbi:MAG: hypothetical protein LBR51_04325 [Bacteroidales bacterium]|jgi:hypothetical protein|nr:hypothetical protein [Bacteroidales bacterium]